LPKKKRGWKPTNAAHHVNREENKSIMCETNIPLDKLPFNRKQTFFNDETLKNPDQG
jgi:hypothetical protein